MRTTVRFSTGDLVTWSNDPPRQPDIGLFGRGPFRLGFVLEVTSEEREAVGHDQIVTVLLDNQSPKSQKTGRWSTFSGAWFQKVTT